MHDPLLPDEPTWTLERVLAVVLGIAIILLTYLTAGGRNATYMFLNAFIANLMIWYPDVMGDHTGYALFQTPAITRPTPEFFIRIGGWFLLLFPVGMVGFAAWLLRGAR